MKHQKKTSVTVSKMRKQLKKLFRQRTIHRKDMLIQLDSNLGSRINISKNDFIFLKAASYEENIENKAIWSC